MPSKMKHCGRQVARLHTVFNWVATLFVTGSVNLASADSRAGHRETEHRSPVVSTAFVVDFGSASKLADRYDQRFVEQPALVEILNQRRKADVELWAEHVFHSVRILSVRIPKWIVDRIVTRFARPLHVNKSNTGFDQSSSEQHTLAPAVVAVTFANRGRFLLNRECVLSFARSEQIEGLLLKLVVKLNFAASLGRVERLVDLC